QVKLQWAKMLFVLVILCHANIEDVCLVDVHPDWGGPFLPLRDRELRTILADRIRLLFVIRGLAEDQKVIWQTLTGSAAILAERFVEQAMRLGALHLHDRVFPDRHPAVIGPTCVLMGAYDVAGHIP